MRDEVCALPKLKMNMAYESVFSRAGSSTTRWWKRNDMTNIRQISSICTASFHHHKYHYQQHIIQRPCIYNQELNDSSGNVVRPLRRSMFARDVIQSERYVEAMYHRNNHCANGNDGYCTTTRLTTLLDNMGSADLWNTPSR